MVKNSASSGEAKHKKRMVAILSLFVILLLVLGGLVGWGVYRYLNPLLLKENNYIAQINSTFDPYDNIRSLAFGSLEDVVFRGKVDTSTPNIYEVQYQYDDKVYPFSVEVADTLPPILEVRDIKTDTYADVTAQDFIVSVSDGSKYAFRIDGVSQPGQEGETKVTITAKDEYGNVTKKTAKLTRQKDETAPQIENFEESISILQGENYQPHTYTPTDDLDLSPEIVIDASNLNSSATGTYPVIYTVQDNSGNQKSYTQNVTVLENPEFGKPVCYLTFDDGPSETTIQILSILKQYGAKATFFVIGANPNYYHLMKNIVDEGHTIALHTFTHDYATLYASEEAYFSDLQQISDLVESQTGIKSNVIRFPGGSSNTIAASYSPNLMSQLVQDVEARGYVYFDWNADSTDASGNNVDPATLVANATQGIGQENVVLLMHDTDAKSTTAQALPQIIQSYQNAGYIFKGLTVDSPEVHHSVN